MPKPSYLTIQLSSDLREQIDLIADLTDQPPAAIVRRALEEFVDRVHAEGIPSLIDHDCQSELVDMFKRWVQTS